MTANLVIHRDAFRPHLHIEKKNTIHGKTIFEILTLEGLCEQTENGLRRVGLFYVMYNGKAVLFQDWNTVVQEKDFIQVVYLPRGGGGGSNIGNILGAIVIAVMAYFTFGLSLYATIAVGAAAYVGMTLLSGAVPPPTSNISNNREASSPTYSLNAQGNSARLLEAIPRVYGRMRTYPDLGAQPYSEYEGNEQYLYQLFVLSLGRVEVEQILVDETPLSTFDDAQYQIINPGEAVTLFPDNVITSEAVTGLTMVGPNNPSYAVLGPYVASPAGQKANYLSVDITLPRGIGRVNDNGDTISESISFTFEFQEVNDQGAAIGPWTILENRTLTYATQRAQILTLKWAVPLGRYQVQAYRTTSEFTDNRAFGEIQWSGLKSYLPSTHVYGNVTMIAVKMKASNVLNSSTARKFSVISRGLVQKWDHVNGWGQLEYTRNWVWIACDILRNQDYGRGLSTERLNIQRFYQLAQTAEVRGDTFDGVFDSTTQLWDALSKVCRVGRAVPIYYSGVIDIIRDQPETIPTAMFQPANMIMGSFKTVYNFFEEDTPDHVIVEYIDPVTWRPQTVSCILPGSPALNPFNVQLFGCTNRDQAWREGMSMAASNRDRRRNISFSTDIDGLIPQYNSLVLISHDVPQWGYSGRVLIINRSTGQIRTTEPIYFNEPVTHYIGFRRRDGSYDGPYEMVEDILTSNQNGVYGCIVKATPAQLAQIYVADDTREEATYYQCGPSERDGFRALVTSVKPDNNGQVNIECINYAESVHTAENGGNVPTPPPASNLPITPSAPIVNSVDVAYTVTVGEQNIVAEAARGAIYYEFQGKLKANSDWTSLGTSDGPILRVNLSPGIWQVRVRGVGRATGPWASWEGEIKATTLNTPFLDTFTAQAKQFAIGLNWSYDSATSVLASRVEIWAAATNNLGSAAKLVDLPYPANAFDLTNLGPGERRYFWARVIDTAGRVGSWFNGSQAITQIASADPAKLLEALQKSIGQGQLTQELLEYIEDAGGSSIVVQELINELAAMRTVKTQIRGSDGKIYTAGYGVGVNNNDGIVQSEFIVSASNFYVIDPNNPNDPGKLMFAITPQGVVMNKAFISQLFVEEIVNNLSLKSQATNSSGQPLIEINMVNGVFKLRGQQGNISTELDNMGISTFIDGVRRTKVGAFNGT